MRSTKRRESWTPSYYRREVAKQLLAPGDTDLCKMQNNVIYYRTKDGLVDYRFSFEMQSDGGYRVYIVSQPDYGSRDTTPSVIHRLSDGRNYICWLGRLNNEGEARAVAALWADNTQEYIKTGRRFG